MSRAYWLQHQGKKILFIDFANTDLAGVQQAVADAKPIISREPPHSILCLVETFNTKFTLDISEAAKEFTLHNKPFMKMTAIVGVEGLQKVILNGVIVATRRKNLIVKGSRQEALDFLARQ